VLRISVIEVLDQPVTIRLEGQVRGAWVEELRRSCEQLLARGSSLRLDLHDVSFVDMDGVALCRGLRDRHVVILHCSPFVAEQLKGAGHGDSLA
jgi:anti-anti-sigma regulatory factor